MWYLITESLSVSMIISNTLENKHNQPCTTFMNKSKPYDSQTNSLGIETTK